MRKKLLWMAGLAAAAAVFIGSQVHADQTLNMTTGTIASGVTYRGESLAGLTYEEALEKCTANLEGLLAAEYRLKAESDADKVVSAAGADLGLSYNRAGIEKTLQDSLLTSTGSLLDRYVEAKTLQHKGVEVDDQFKVNSASVTEFFSSAAESWGTEPVSATFTLASGRLYVTPSEDGYKYDVTAGIQKLLQDMENQVTVKNGVYYVDCVETVTAPEVTTERAASFSIIGEYTTSFPLDRDDEISLNRLQNLVTSTSNMNGRSFAPGEVISALEMYGDVTIANGYRPAGTYVNGGHSDELGGGICQTTTTLYNAILNAELEIVYRHNHSMVVNYVNPSKDAMVYAQGGSDFKFKNSSSDYLYIYASVDDKEQTLTVTLVGIEEHSADHEVSYETEIVSISPPNFKVVVDPTLPIGWTTKQKFYVTSDDVIAPSVKSKLWKIVTENGVTTRTLFTNTDTYKASTATIYVSADCYAEILARSGLVEDDGGFLEYIGHFADGTAFTDSPMDWTDDELTAFNERMTAICAEKGLVWPDTGASFSVDGQIVIDHNETSVDETTETEGETTGESESASN